MFLFQIDLSKTDFLDYGASKEPKNRYHFVKETHFSLHPKMNTVNFLFLAKSVVQTSFQKIKVFFIYSHLSLIDPHSFNHMHHSVKSCKIS